MGSNTSKQSTATQSSTKAADKPKQKDAWDIDALSQYRLNDVEFERKLFEAIVAYWDEVYLLGIEQEEAEQPQQDGKEKEYALQQESNLGNSEKNLTEKVLFGNMHPGKKGKRKDLKYFTDEVYEEWSWTLYLDGSYGVFEKQTKYPPLYERAVYHFKVKLEQIQETNQQLFEYHDAETLAKNELHELFWIFVGYQYRKVHKAAENHFLGDEHAMMQFLQNLSLLFKVILLAYNYEQYQYKKVVNHYMKPVLANIDKPVLDYALDIARKKKKEGQYPQVQAVYENISRRLEGTKPYLAENGIEVKKTLQL